MHHKDSSDENFGANELIDSYVKNAVRKDLQREQQICIALQTFPISPLAPLDPRKNQYFIFLINFHLIIFVSR